MDEQEARIAEAFRDAAAHAPPAAFDAADVVATSRRITRRRRSAVAGAALAVVAVVGFGVAGLAGGSGSTLTTAAGRAQGESAQGESAQDAAAPGAAAPGAAGGAAPEAAQEPGVAPAAPAPAPEQRSAAGSGPSGGAPLGPAPTGRCADYQDPALRVLVEQVLPEVVGAAEGPVAADCSLRGDRGVSLEVRDGAATGVLVVRYVAPGDDRVPTEGRRRPTASGGTVVAYSWATRGGDPAPFADRLDAVVDFLAPRL